MYPWSTLAPPSREYYIGLPMLTRPLVALRRLRWRFVAAAFAGALYAASFAQPYLGWLCLLPLLWALADLRVPRWAGVAMGWVFGTVAQLGAPQLSSGTLAWLAGFSWFASAITHVGAAVLQGSLWAGWAALCLWLTRQRRLSFAWAAPLAAVVCEWLWPSLSPLYLASSQLRQTLLIQSLSLWGPLGLTFIMALATATGFQLLAYRRRFMLPLAFLLVLVVGSLAFGVAALRDIDDSIAHAPRFVTVGLVQANAGGQHEEAERLRRYQQQTDEVRRQGAELVIWPATAPVPPATARSLIAGSTRVEHDRWRSWVTFLDPEGQAQSSFAGCSWPLNDGAKGLMLLWPHRGLCNREKGGTAWLDGVAYGVLLGDEELQTQLVRRRIEAEPQVLLSLNGSLLGTPAQEQQLAALVFRAVESRRFVLRGNDIGVSAIIDAAGRIVALGPPGARANLVGKVAALEGRTVYQRLGAWPGYLCAVVILAVSKLLRRLVGVLRRVFGARLKDVPKTPAPS